MKFEYSKVTNFDGAFRGLRNPLESWNKSDSSYFVCGDFPSQADATVAAWIYKTNPDIEKCSVEWDNLFNHYSDWLISEGTLTNGADNYCGEYFWIGPNDMDLAQRMIKAGSSDRKFMRQIMVCVDITAPLYWWKEMDQYKVATVTNSTSTMHKLSSTPITIDCFEMDDFNPNLTIETYPNELNDIIYEYWEDIIDKCEKLRVLFNKTKDKQYWKELIRLLPESWLQTRTITLNYEILRNIYTQRRHHKLTEWHTFCDWIKTLPYAKSLILYGLD